MKNRIYHQIFTVVGMLALTIVPSGLLHSQTFSVLHTFTGAPADGSQPLGPPVIDAQGNLYGATQAGGAYGNSGTVFEVTPTGQEKVIYSLGSLYVPFPEPAGGVALDGSGNVYSTTSDVIENGSIFEVTKNGHHGISLYTFTGGGGGDGGWAMYAALVLQGSRLYGTAVGNPVGGPCYSSGQQAPGCGTVWVTDVKTGNFHVLHEFKAKPAKDGRLPFGGVIQDAAGNLYGTTLQGGTYDFGTIFELTKGGNYSTLYSFHGKAGVGSGGPLGTLALDANGNLYGTTWEGGTTTCLHFSFGCGTVFKFNPKTKKETVLHVFKGADGLLPQGSVALDMAGNLYGTSTYGGILSDCSSSPGCGVVWEVDHTGKFKVLHEFNGSADGAFPDPGVVLDKEGNLYGMTTQGGEMSCGSGVGCGTVYKLTP